jgi:hypothetical protein
MEDKLNRLVAAKRRIRRAWRPLQQRLGAAGIAGVALLAAAAIGLLYAPQILLEADSMHFAVDRTRARLAEIDRELAATPGSVRQLDRFHTWLPPFGQSSSDMRTLFDIAAKSQIQLIKGEYALKQDNAHHIARLEIVLPIKDSYRDIRGFVAATLDALPHASLSELRMERSAPNVEPLDARLRITMFYRDR